MSPYKPVITIITREIDIHAYFPASIAARKQGDVPSASFLVLSAVGAHAVYTEAAVHNLKG
jgi:hypothetical protein